MRRFRGENLPAAPRLALITSDALGNFVAVTPLLQMLRQHYPSAHLTYFGGTRTRELWEVDSSIDCGIAIFGRPLSESVAEALKLGPFDLVINLEACELCCFLASAISGPDTFVAGHAFDAEGRQKLPYESDERGTLWHDPNWTAADIVQRYSFLDSSFIGSIFCRLCYLTGPVPRYRVAKCTPPGAPFDIILSTAASLPEKLWPTVKWLEVVNHLKAKGLRMGVVGAKRTCQSRYWHGADTEEALIEECQLDDLRGQFTLPQVVGLLDKARAVLTIDNGVLHLAAATETQTVGLFRDRIVRLWAPPASRVSALSPDEGGTVSEIPVRTVLEAVGF